MIAFTEPVVHSSADRGDAIAFICVGIAIAVIMYSIKWGASKANEFWTKRADQAAASADAGRTLAADFVPHPEDVAAIEAEHPVNMPGVVTREPVQGKPGRLVEHWNAHGPGAA